MFVLLFSFLTTTLNVKSEIKKNEKRGARRGAGSRAECRRKRIWLGLWKLTAYMEVLLKKKKTTN